MKYQIPKTFMGKPVAGSLERVLAGLNTDPNSGQGGNLPLDPSNLSGYIFVPSINLHVAKQRTHLGLSWYKTHEELQKENLKMPTIPQFLKYLKFLQDDCGYQNRSEAQIILNDVLKPRSHGEWLDAKFLKIQDNLTISYNHKLDSNGNLKPDNNELLLLDCLKENCWVDIFGSANVQGLPTRELGNNYEEGKNAYFLPPLNHMVVAWLGGDSSGVGLNCCGAPTGSLFSLGVFACREF